MGPKIQGATRRADRPLQLSANTFGTSHIYWIYRMVFVGAHSVLAVGFFFFGGGSIYTTSTIGNSTAIEFWIYYGAIASFSIVSLGLQC